MICLFSIKPTSAPLNRTSSAKWVKYASLFFFSLLSLENLNDSKHFSLTHHRSFANIVIRTLFECHSKRNSTDFKFKLNLLIKEIVFYAISFFWQRFKRKKTEKNSKKTSEFYWLLVFLRFQTFEYVFNEVAKSHVSFHCNGSNSHPTDLSV